MIKKLILMLILIIFCQQNALTSPQSARIEYDKNPFDSIYNDSRKTLNTANKNMLMWENSLKGVENKAYLEQAMRFYYITSQIDNSIIDASMGLGRVYDAMNQDILAKEYFYKALNISPADGKTNLFFGNFYYKREDYLTALKYYKIAYKNGFSKNIELNIRIAKIYEKLADIETAKAFYAQALKLNPKDKDLTEKIRLLDELNYSDSQYYLFNKKK